MGKRGVDQVLSNLIDCLESCHTLGNRAASHMGG